MWEHDVLCTKCDHLVCETTWGPVYKVWSSGLWNNPRSCVQSVIIWSVKQPEVHWGEKLKVIKWSLQAIETIKCIEDMGLLLISLFWPLYGEECNILHIHWKNPERQDMPFTHFVLGVLPVNGQCKVSIGVLFINSNSVLSYLLSQNISTF